MGSGVQLPVNIYNALNLRKVLSGITSRMFIHGGYDLTDILCSVQIKQRRREGNVEKRKEEREGRRERKKKGRKHSNRIFFHSTLSLYYYFIEVGFHCFGMPKLLYFNPDIITKSLCIRTEPNINRAVLIFLALEPDILQFFYLKKNHESLSIIIKTIQRLFSVLFMTLSLTPRKMPAHSRHARFLLNANCFCR